MYVHKINTDSDSKCSGQCSLELSLHCMYAPMQLNKRGLLRGRKKSAGLEPGLYKRGREYFNGDLFSGEYGMHMCIICWLDVRDTMQSNNYVTLTVTVDASLSSRSYFVHDVHVGLWFTSTVSMLMCRYVLGFVCVMPV